MKKLVGIILSICMLSSCLFMFTSCNKDGEAATGRMTVDINPSVEFMLDKDNKVVSATALNDDGEVILYGEAFVGKTAEEAAKMVVEIATETGYLVKGEATATTDEIKISVASDTAAVEDLYNKIETKVNEYVSKENIAGACQKVDAMAMEQLKKHVVENTEYTEEQVKDMTAKQLYAALGVARIETAEMYSEELRNAYNTAKNYEFKFAEKEETAKVIQAMGEAQTVIYNTYKKALDTYKSAIEAVENARFEYLVAADSAYQTALANLRAAKEDCIKQKKFVATLTVGSTEYQAAVTVQANLEEVYATAVSALEKAGAAANTAIDQVVEALNTGYEAFAALEKLFVIDIKTELENKATEIDAALNTTKTNFFNKFETAHKGDIDAVNNKVKEYKETLKAIAAGEAEGVEQAA